MDWREDFRRRELAREAARKALRKLLSATGRTMTEDERREWIRKFLKGR
jgi:hypothetical protein